MFNYRLSPNFISITNTFQINTSLAGLFANKNLFFLTFSIFFSFFFCCVYVWCHVTYLYHSCLNSSCFYVGNPWKLCIEINSDRDHNQGVAYICITTSWLQRLSNSKLTTWVGMELLTLANPLVMINYYVIAPQK